MEAYRGSNNFAKVIPPVNGRTRTTTKIAHYSPLSIASLVKFS